MLNLIKANLYKYSNRQYMYVMTALFSGLIILLGIFASISSGFSSREVFITEFFPMGLDSLIYIVTLFSVGIQEEYKFGSLKNTVLSGKSKVKIFLSEFISSVIAGLIVAVVIFIVFMVTIYCLKLGDGYRNELIGKVIFRIVAIIPILIAAIAIFNLISVKIKGEYLVAVLYFVLLIMPYYIIELLSRTVYYKIGDLRNILIFYQSKVLKDLESSNSDLIIAALVGIGITIVCTVIGAIYFKKSEVK